MAIPKPAGERVRVIDSYENNQPCRIVVAMSRMSRMSNISVQRCEGKKESGMLECLLYLFMKSLYRSLAIYGSIACRYSSGCCTEGNEMLETSTRLVFVAEGGKRGL